MGRYSRSYPGSSTPLSPVDDDGTTTAPPYPPSPPPSWVSLPTVDLYLPSSQPRCLSSGSSSRERHQRAWIFIASMNWIKRALRPKYPSLRIFPASRASILWHLQRMRHWAPTGAAITTGGCVWVAFRPKSDENCSVLGMYTGSVGGLPPWGGQCVGGGRESSGGGGRGGGGSG